MSKRVLGKKTTRLLGGKVIISIECYFDSFKITLKFAEDIPKMTRLRENTEKVRMNLVWQKDKKREISITRTVSYKKDSEGVVKPIKLKILYNKNQWVNGFLTVSPEFYLPLGMRKYAEAKQLMERGLLMEIHDKNPRSSPSKFIPYRNVYPSHHYRG